jgi:hypothetical protein
MIVLDQQQKIADYWKNICKNYSIQNNRQRHNVIYRHAFAMAVLENSVLPMKVIGNMIDRDHATVIHARKNHQTNYLYDKKYAAAYLQISNKIKDFCEEYDDSLMVLLKSRAVKITDEGLLRELEETQERKIKRLEDKYKSEAETLRLENKALSKTLTKALERNHYLHEELARLKNII